MRKFPFAALILLAACGDSDRGAQEALAADPANRIACAVEGATAFKSSCIVERTAGDEGSILTLHHPSGGFRRLLVTGDGRGVVAADGAEPAIVSIIADDRIEVSIADDRYRLPATVKALRQGQ
ncbi:hypothetical protein [Sphingosinicella humi]|uniref:Lipoprotein n=1 Tax=Allosphingosinicella humi TaxID=2068657 RepID=A0A2U2IZ31_9SPHN|nr:hypothetical protein [Sphingosinicella humi]PWG01339.1 hypothetical protein DF286_14550 [Sphingosinicella humi]